jgi:uncharacterized linocin/CFP29 family protein
VNHLRRELAPVSTAAWKQIDDEASSRLRTYLAARRLVDFDGPRGWEYSAIDLGRADDLAVAPSPNVVAQLRRVQPLVELRVTFNLDRSDLDNADRGDPAIELGPLDIAVRQLALAENVAVFHGYEAGGIRGITEESSYPLIPIRGDWSAYPSAVASAVAKLRGNGVSGPYGLALGDEAWLGVSETIEPGGYPLLEHLTRIVGGPIVWAPGVAGGILISQRGGDFIIHSGQDLSIGYLDHDQQEVTLYLEESFTFRVLEPEAAIGLDRNGPDD